MTEEVRVIKTQVDGRTVEKIPLRVTKKQEVKVITTHGVFALVHEGMSRSKTKRSHNNRMTLRGTVIEVDKKAADTLGIRKGSQWKVTIYDDSPQQGPRKQEPRLILEKISD